MQPYLTYILVHFLKIFSKIFYRCEVGWIGDPPKKAWKDLRLVCILNHTSLYEWLYASTVPDVFIRQLAWHGVVPVAEKTVNRPMIGLFYRMLARHVVSITRKRDHTWAEVLERIEDNAVVVMLPEGRMKRANGLDLRGKPMDIRGGVADVVRAIPSGRILVAYSGGLHHVQHPGETFPRLFKTIRMNFEILDIEAYRSELLDKHGEEGFRDALRRDLEERRDRFCPPETPWRRPLSPSAEESANES